MLRDRIHAAVVAGSGLFLLTLVVGCSQPSAPTEPVADLSRTSSQTAEVSGPASEVSAKAGTVKETASDQPRSQSLAAAAVAAAGKEESDDGQETLGDSNKENAAEEVATLEVEGDELEGEDVDDLSDEGEDEDGPLPDLPEPGSALKYDEDGNVIPDGPPPVPNDDPVNVYKEVPAEWIKMPGQATWIDKKNGTVIVDGRICRKTGLLELLVCTGGYKMHESVISAHTKPSTVMAALLVVGAVPGGPAEFDPKFTPAHGTQVDMTVRWMEGDEEVVVPAQDLLIDIKTQDVVDLPWVLAGSGMWRGVDGGPERFAADHTGDFVCVSNFASCMLDLPAELSDSNEMLAFTPNTELIPPLGTKVRMVLTPRVKKAAPEAKKKEADGSPVENK